jgi:hypothetical protein
VSFVKYLDILISKDNKHLTNYKMEIIEIVSYHQNEKITEVVFRAVNDDEDMVRTDEIENTYFDEFGYGFLAPVSDFLFEDEDYEGDDDFLDYIDEDDLMSFLYEFYVVYPEKLPPSEYE